MLYSVKLLEPHNLTGLCSCPEQLRGSISILSTRRREAEQSASFLQGNNVAQRALKSRPQCLAICLPPTRKGQVNNYVQHSWCFLAGYVTLKTHLWSRAQTFTSEMSSLYPEEDTLLQDTDVEEADHSGLTELPQLTARKLHLFCSTTLCPTVYIPSNVIEKTAFSCFRACPRQKLCVSCKTCIEQFLAMSLAIRKRYFLWSPLRSAVVSFSHLNTYQVFRLFSSCFRLSRVACPQTF